MKERQKKLALVQLLLNQQKKGNQELLHGAECGKYATAKTFKYTHSSTCGEVKKSKPNKSKISINEIVQEDKLPSPVPTRKVEGVK